MRSICNGIVHANATSVEVLKVLTKSSDEFIKLLTIPSNS
jgi:hypothetical protein